MNKGIKKLLCGIVCMAMLVGTTAALSACNDGEPEKVYTCTQETGHVDADHDGKCDNCQAKMAVETPSETEVKADDLNGGYFGTNLNGQKDVFIHLYPNGYCYLSSASVNAIYKYSVKAESIEIPTSGDDTTPAQSCEKQLIVYNNDGTVHATFGYHDEKLYTGSYLYYLTYDWEGTEPKSSYQEATTFKAYKEVGGSEYDSFNLGVDGTFTDEIASDAVEGTWINGGNAYVFLDADGNQYAGLVENSSARATLTYADGTVKSLYIAQEEKTVYKFTGTEANADYTLALKSDATGSYIGELGYKVKADGTLDEGGWTTGVTWKMNDKWPAYENNPVWAYIDGKTNASTRQPIIAAQSVAITVDEDGVYTAVIKLPGDINITLTYQLTKIVELTGNNGASVGQDVSETLTIFSDGTAKFNVSAYGGAVNQDYFGTWVSSLTSGTGTYTVTLAGDKVGTAIPEIIVVNVNLGAEYTAKVSVNLESAIEIDLSYTSVTMDGAGKGNVGAEVDVNVSVTADVKAMKAYLTLAVPSYGMTLANGVEAELTEEDGTYTATFTVTGQSTQTFTLTFTVSQKGVYSGTISGGILTGDIAVTFDPAA